MNSEAVRMDVYRMAIPMRTFEHAAAARDVSETIVVRLKYRDGRLGWGETLPRPYVTGETIRSVADDLERIIWSQCVRGGVVLPDGLAIPTRDGDRCISAAACAFDLAASRRFFGGDGASPLGAIRELAGRARPRRVIDVRISGVLGSARPARTAWQLRLMRLYGLRDFKLKLGFGEDIDAENLKVVHKSLCGAIRNAACTLRVDVNGGWDADSTPDRVARLKHMDVCAVEQPVFCRASEFVELARKCELPLMADETLLTLEDAAVLAAEPRRIWWNIRISKNGGFEASLRLALLAAEKSIAFTLGCMVGESSILAAAQRRLLEWGPVPRFCEGNYGKYLLADDLTIRSLRFGLAGRLKPLGPSDLGVWVNPAKVDKYGQILRTVKA